MTARQHQERAVVSIQCVPEGTVMWRRYEGFRSQRGQAGSFGTVIRSGRRVSADGGFQDAFRPSLVLGKHAGKALKA
jgi:hypothetical protein